MAPSAPQVFNGITPAHYAILTEKAKAAGIELSGPSGTANSFGVKVAWNYSAESETLTLQCMSTPFFIQPADVDAKIQHLVKQALA